MNRLIIAALATFCGWLAATETENLNFNILPKPGAVVVDAPAPPAGSAGQAERDQYAAAIANLRRQTLSQAKPIENRIYYADYRNVDGLKLPFRIRRAVAGETIEETTFDQIRINAKIDPRKFEVSK